MKLMSFSMTKAAFLDGSKTVTRRMGWKSLKPGDVLMAVEKCQGLKKGEKVSPLGKLEVVSVRREPLNAINATDVALEGYPFNGPVWFVSHFAKAMRCEHDAEVTRIAFRRIP